MATVFFPKALRSVTGGAKEWEVEASSMRELGAKLEEAFPGIRVQLESAAVAIDGDVMPGAWLERLETDSEIHFLPAISGG